MITAAPPTPVNPHPAATPSTPRSQRTPVFPNLHISRDPVHRRRRGAIALLLVLILTAGAGVGAWWWTAGRFTTVPAMATINEAKAREAAGVNDLHITTTEEYSETVARGIVIRTDPTAGERLLRGEKVNLVLSKGPERYPMPTVVGANRETAEKALTDGNLAVGKVDEVWSESKPAGEVLTASQEPGTQLKPGTSVDLTVSKGREPIRIPDFTGASADKAKADLQKLGFEVAIEEEHNADVKAGVVIRQDPKGVDAHRGDTVTIVKSLGPVMVTIPDVRLASTAEATKKLEDLDLVVKLERTSDFPILLDIASGTNPEAGKSVPVGTTVTLYVA